MYDKCDWTEGPINNNHGEEQNTLVLICSSSNYTTIFTDTLTWKHHITFCISLLYLLNKWNSLNICENRDKHSFTWHCQMTWKDIWSLLYMLLISTQRSKCSISAWKIELSITSLFALQCLWQWVNELYDLHLCSLWFTLVII